MRGAVHHKKMGVATDYHLFQMGGLAREDLDVLAEEGKTADTHLRRGGYAVVRPFRSPCERSHSAHHEKD